MPKNDKNAPAKSKAPAKSSSSPALSHYQENLGAAPAPLDVGGLVHALAGGPGPSPAPAPAPVQQAPGGGSYHATGFRDPVGGLNLSALADQGRAESQTRIAGQGNLIDAYVAQNLGEQRAGFQADSERDQRMAEFRRNQALMQEALEEARRGQQASLQRQQFASAAEEAQAQRDFEAQQLMMEQAFELGNIAAMREEDLAQPTEFGRGEVSFDRGWALSDDKVNEIRGSTMVEGKGGGWGPLNVGARDAQTYQDIFDDKAYTIRDQYGQDPMVLVAQLQKAFQNDPMATSLALRDLGYNPAAFMGAAQ